MYQIITFILLVLFVFCFTLKNKENFKVWGYEFPLSIYQVKDKCQLTGLIDEFDNPVGDMCFYGYYIPYIYNFGTYQSEVNNSA